MEGLGEESKLQRASIMNVEDDKVPDGLRYHVIDVWVDGMMECKDWTSEKEVLLEPMERVAKGGKTRILRTRAKAALDDTRLKGDEEEKPGEDDVFEGFESE